MNLAGILLIYGAAVALAAVALYVYGACRWYWHVLSVLLAVALGLAPAPPAAWRGQTYDLIVGFLFVLFVVWGIGGTLPMRAHHHPRHA